MRGIVLVNQPDRYILQTVLYHACTGVCVRLNGRLKQVYSVLLYYDAALAQLVEQLICNQ